MVLIQPLAWELLYAAGLAIKRRRRRKKKKTQKSEERERKEKKGGREGEKETCTHAQKLWSFLQPSLGK